MKRAGINLVELIIAIAVVLMAFVVFMTVFSSSSRGSLQSRNRTAAILLANSLMDEIEAHPYGAPAPKSWTSAVDQPVHVWVEGRNQIMDFHKKLTYQNGSFVGNVTGDQDLVTINISWREGIGDTQSGVVDPQDNKVLSVRSPVWRGDPGAV